MIGESSNAVFRPDLQAQVSEYNAQNAARRFIAPLVAPLYRSMTRRGHYPIFRREAFKKMMDLKRNPDGSYNSIRGSFGDGSFVTDDNGGKYPIDDARRAEFASLFDAELVANRILWQQIMLGWEYRVGQLLSGGGFTNHNVATAWSTTASATPLDDLQTGIETLCDVWGCVESDITLIIPRADFKELLATTQVIEKAKYTFRLGDGIQPAQLSAAQLAAMLDIKQVLKAQSVYDSTEEGVAETNTMVWTAGVMYLTVCANANDPLEIPSAARTVLWTDDSPEIPTVETYRNDDLRSDIVRHRANTDEMLLLDSTDPMVYQLTNT